jgi:hypothetical protein
MYFYLRSGTAVFIAAVLTAFLCASASGQDAQTRDAKGLPPRAAPTDYQAHAQAGAVTIAADFAGHGVPTGESVYSTEDSIVFEVGVFGPPAAHLNLSYKDFSLRINGKKAPQPAQPYEAAFSALKDPEWTAPDEADAKANNKTSLGGGGQTDPSVFPTRMPMPRRLAMEQKVQKASIPEGDRVLPGAGLIFFPYHGKLSGIRSIELLYNGAAGKATLSLQP